TSPSANHAVRRLLCGRPRKKDNSGRGGQPNIGFEDRIKSVAIEEAYRLVNIREGDRVERIPLVQAIIRKLGLAAAPGHIRAAQSFLNLLIGAEADRRVATKILVTISFRILTISWRHLGHHLSALSG